MSKKNAKSYTHGFYTTDQANAGLPLVRAGFRMTANQIRRAARRNK